MVLQGQDAWRRHPVFRNLPRKVCCSVAAVGGVYACGCFRCVFVWCRVLFVSTYPTHPAQLVVPLVQGRHKFLSCILFLVAVPVTHEATVVLLQAFPGLKIGAVAFVVFWAGETALKAAGVGAAPHAHR